MFLAFRMTLAVLTVSCSMIAGYTNAAIVDNLLLHSPLDAGTFTGVTNGSTVDDVVAPAQNGTVVGPDLASVGGLMGEAFNYPASRETYVNYGNILNPGTGDFTASVWFNADVLPSGYAVIGGKGAHNTSADGWMIAVQDDTMEFRVNTNTSSMFAIDSNSGALTAGNWYHAALVIDRTSNVATAYLNGSGSAFTTNTANIGTGSVTNSSALVLGVRSTNFDLGLDGTLDDFAIWDRALSSAEIQEIYSKGLLGFNVQESVPAPIPEPSTFVLLSFLCCVGFARRRKSQRA